ncbi:MAG TPA: hypothetical protein VFM29_04345 [Vicinamibacteria bacterium]|nr:hypothetical protein [Vicinamibacteria bacterium]
MHDAGLLVYEGQTREEGGTRPAEYAFVVQFGSEHTAEVLANVLWSELHAAAARVVVDGALIPLEPAAIRDALLGVPV